VPSLPSPFHSRNHGLYAITPQNLPPDLLLAACAAVLTGGCRWLQYRDKTASLPTRRKNAQALRNLCHHHQAMLIVNDNPALAWEIGADGVHLGRDDGNLADARRFLGDTACIGVSCYADFERARQLAAEGANYLAFGAFFASPTKPEAPPAPLALLTRARAELKLPVCAIGGITLDNAPQTIAAGATLVAVISDLFGGLAASTNNQTLPSRLAALTARARAYQSLFNETQPS
jgi:thiamine-phosphate pyrophosphorylase